MDYTKIAMMAIEHQKKAEEARQQRIAAANSTNESLRPGFSKRRPTVEFDDPSMADEYYG
jgi:hypothetical protein